MYVWKIVLHLMQCFPFKKMRGHVSKSLHIISLFICLGSRLVRDVVTACSNDLVYVGCFFSETLAGLIGRDKLYTTLVFLPDVNAFCDLIIPQWELELA
jgi:hypothetical protein